MTRIDEARARLVAFFEAEVDAALSRAQNGRNGEPEALIEAADEIGARVRQRAYQELTAAAARYEAAPSCPACGRGMLRHDRVRRPVLGLHGPLRGEFQRWRCRRCRRETCPALARLGLRHGCERRLVRVAAKLCAHEAFELAEAVLAEFGLQLSDNTLQRLAHEVGGERVSARQRAVAEVMEHGYPQAVVGRAPQRLYLEVDGFKAKVERQWREPRAAVIFETGTALPRTPEERPQRQRVSVLATLTDCRGLAAWVTAELARWNVAEAAEVVVLGDGAEWIWEHVAQVVPHWVKRVEILDWYHLCEHLATAAGGEQAAYERLQDSAWVGDTNRLLAQLRQQQELATGERREELRRVVAYVQTHRHRMDYQNRRADGYIVGSGEVESRCRQFGRRVKSAGTNWTEEGLDAVLHLLADDLTDPDLRWGVAA